MRRSDAAFTVVLAGLALTGLTLIHAALDDGAARARRAELVARLELTDLVLFTEARYTRHPSQADLHSAFQDHPMALGHFPSGSLLPPRKESMNRAPLD